MKYKWFPVTQAGIFRSAVAVFSVWGRKKAA